MNGDDTGSRSRGGDARNGHPANLALRFLLELATLGSFAFWGWTTQAGFSRVLWAVGFPLLAALAWGTFRVPGDPGDAPVAVPGPVRLSLEAVLFAGAVVSLAAAGESVLASAFAASVVGHYGIAHERVRWLLGAGRERKSGGEG